MVASHLWPPHIHSGISSAHLASQTPLDIQGWLSGPALQAEEPAAPSELRRVLQRWDRVHCGPAHHPPGHTPHPVASHCVEHRCLSLPTLSPPGAGGGGTQASEPVQVPAPPSAAGTAHSRVSVTAATGTWPSASPGRSWLLGSSCPGVECGCLMHG